MNATDLTTGLRVRNLSVVMSRAQVPLVERVGWRRSSGLAFSDVPIPQDRPEISDFTVKQ
jgi:hypothetical protein